MKQTLSKREKVFKAAGGLCVYCKIPMLIEEMTLDHVLPRSKGGTSRIENLVAACASCNHAKGCSILPSAERMLRRQKLKRTKFTTYSFTHEFPRGWPDAL